MPGLPKTGTPAAAGALPGGPIVAFDFPEKKPNPRKKAPLPEDPGEGLELERGGP